MYIIHRDEAFGDVMMAGLVVAVLNDNGYQACLDNFGHGNLLDCPKYAGEAGEHVWFEYESVRQTSTVSYVENFLQRFGPLKLTRRAVPVKFEEMAVPHYDVALGTKTGPWTPYRNWPSFPQLKECLDKRGLTWIDLDEQNKNGNECLNIIKQCGVFVGLETGRSHYVSSVGAGKTLIIQSGYTPSRQWCVYDYDFIEKAIPCSPCYLRAGCTFNHDCMKTTPEEVLDWILHRGKGHF